MSAASTANSLPKNSCLLPFGTYFALILGMKWPVVWRLNLILALWIILSLAFFVRPARAESTSSSRTNHFLQETSKRIELQKARIDVTNKIAPNLRNGIEFLRQDGRSYGVDMRLNAPLPDFEEDLSYEPKGLQSEVESELQDQQTTDYVVERTWIEIRRDLEEQSAHMKGSIN